MKRSLNESQYLIEEDLSNDNSSVDYNKDIYTNSCRSPYGTFITPVENKISSNE